MTGCNPSSEQEPLSAKQEQDDVVLRIDGLGKKFAYSSSNVRRYGVRRLLRELTGRTRNQINLNPGEFWALLDVSFTLRRGETLGILGRNGAGKSTLLKIINGVYLPDRGKAAIRGSVGGLIEIGAGFQPGLSGLDNIYLVGAILGMTSKEIDASLDDIISFADIGRFIRSPVQSYSSGMKVRLGFAIHVFQKPDLLLADEVLAVGDFDFRQKCLAKVNEMKSASAMILVSHSMPDIIRFCDRALVLEDAKIAFSGDPSDAVTFFTRTQAEQNPRANQTDGRSKSQSHAKQKASVPATGQNPENQDSNGFVCFPSGKRVAKRVFGAEYEDPSKISDVTYEWHFNGASDRQVVDFGADAKLSFSFQLRTTTNRLNIGVAILSLEGQMVTGFYADITELEIPILATGMVSGALVIPRLRLNPGEYGGSLAVFDGTEYLYRKVFEGISILRLKSTEEGPSLYHGLYTESYDWHFIKGG